jgi:sodium pump decarboxylase gamma subunit
MSELIWQGLQVSVLGMGLTFAALGLLILAMMALERLFRIHEEADSVEVTAVSPAEEDEVAVAIAVALNYLHARDRDTSDLGANLKAGRGAWWQNNHTYHRRRTQARKASWRHSE